MNEESAIAVQPNLRPDEGDSINRRLVGWGALVGFLIVIEYAGNASTSASTRAAQDALYKYSTAISGGIVYAIWLGVILIIAHHRFDLFALRPPKSWGRAAALGLIALVFSYAAIRAMDPFLHAGREQGLVPDHWEPSKAGPFAANWIVVGVAAPIVEEMTFRGLGYSLILARWGRVLAAIIGAGLLFAAAHGLVQAFPELACLGLALAWVRSKVDSVYPGMVIHAVFNSLALIAVLAS